MLAKTNAVLLCLFQVTNAERHSKLVVKEHTQLKIRNSVILNIGEMLCYQLFSNSAISAFTGTDNAMRLTIRGFRLFNFQF